MMVATKLTTIGAKLKVLALKIMKYLTSFKIFIFLAVLFFLLFIPHVFVLKWGSLDVTVWDKKKGKIIKTLYKESPHWHPLEKVSHMTLASIIVAEDVFFYDHYGIDVNSIYKSLKANYKAGHIKGGASTITQQLVRLAFLNPKKSYIRKIREILGALLLELLLTKEEILTWYLNIIYFGNGLTGIKEASLSYFATEPNHLNLNNSIHLALILPRPNFFGKQILKKELGKTAQERFYFILKELRNNQFISPLQWKNALSTGNFGTPILIQKKPSYDK